MSDRRRLLRSRLPIRTGASHTEPRPCASFRRGNRRTDCALDEIALAELYDRYSGAAFGLARRVLRDDALAEDAVQEAFLAIWRGAVSVHPGAGEGEHLDPDARSSPRRRSRAPRGAPPHRAARGHGPRRRRAAPPRTSPGSGSSATGSRVRCASCPTSSARRSSSPTTVASRNPSWPSGLASRSARSRAACSPA